MPTKKKRINVTLPKPMAVFIKQISLRNDVAESTTIVQLLKHALEIEEDFCDNAIAEERLRTMTGTISHKDFWSRARR